MMKTYWPQLFGKRVNRTAQTLRRWEKRGLLATIHCFSSRLYGLRKYKKALKDIVTDDPHD